MILRFFELVQTADEQHLRPQLLEPIPPTGAVEQEIYDGTLLQVGEYSPMLVKDVYLIHPQPSWGSQNGWCVPIPPRARGTPCGSFSHPGRHPRQGSRRYRDKAGSGTGTAPPRFHPLAMHRQVHDLLAARVEAHHLVSLAARALGFGTCGRGRYAEIVLGLFRRDQPVPRWNQNVHAPSFRSRLRPVVT